MCRKVLFLVLVVGLFAGAAWAIPITVENYSFELPNAGKQWCWDGEKAGSTDVPGWSSDTTPVDSGVESGYWASGADGLWTGFLMGDDPSVYNLTDHIIAAGQIFTLTIDARDNGGGAQDFELALYYEGSRIEAASKVVQLTGDVTEYSLSFTANDVPASIGKKIGIELDNVGGGWAGFDYVRLDYIPEPATIALLGIGGLALLRRKRS